MKLSNGRNIHSPQGIITRPTSSRVRLAVMNTLRYKLSNARWLDLYCGSGIMGCEALIRGAKVIIAIDREYRAINTSRYNLQITQKYMKIPSSIALYKADALNWLDRKARLLRGFDIIYVDPPYSDGVYEITLKKIARNKWLNFNGIIAVECDSSGFLVNSKVWNLVDERSYGKTKVYYLNLRLQHHDDTDSKLQ